MAFRIRDKIGEILYPVNSNDYWYQQSVAAVEGQQFMPRLTEAAVAAQTIQNMNTYQIAGLAARKYVPAKPKLIAPVLDQLMDSGHFDGLTDTQPKMIEFGFDVRCSFSLMQFFSYISYFQGFFPFSVQNNYQHCLR